MRENLFKGELQSSLKFKGELRPFEGEFSLILPCPPSTSLAATSFDGGNKGEFKGGLV